LRIGRRRLHFEAACASRRYHANDNDDEPGDASSHCRLLSGEPCVAGVDGDALSPCRTFVTVVHDAPGFVNIIDWAGT
jgi:hypothetical protein